MQYFQITFKAQYFKQYGFDTFHPLFFKFSVQIPAALYLAAKYIYLPAQQLENIFRKNLGGIMNYEV